jgi:hypothetical protein
MWLIDMGLRQPSTLAETGKPTTGKNFADRPYFDEIRQNGTVVVSDVFVGAPFYTGSGEVDGWPWPALTRGGLLPFWHTPMKVTRFWWTVPAGLWAPPTATSLSQHLTPPRGRVRPLLIAAGRRFD